MACYHLLQAYRVVSTGAVVFQPPSSAFLELKIPCGQCFGCRLERSRQWAVRCVHEASLYEDNSFVTLTYDDAHLPLYGSLDKTAFPRFMKRLRKSIEPAKVRFFHAGEYGELYGRPHYHACLFGYDFGDKYNWAVRNDLPVWRSPSLEALWPMGQSEIGSVTFESAAYVARYIMKKVTGRNAASEYAFVDENGELRFMEREYTTMSRRPGIGKPWLDKYMYEVYPEDSVVMRGTLMKPPRYYDLAHELVNPTEAESVCSERRRRRKVLDNTPERLAVREKCAIARGDLFPRECE